MIDVCNGPAPAGRVADNRENKLKSIKIALTCTAVSLAACSDAQKSSEVVPAPISPSNYSSYSCKQLQSEVRTLQDAIPRLQAAVDKGYKNDKTIEAVTWILFWPAVFAMDGNDSEVTALSVAQGNLNAVRSQMRQKNCAA